MEIVKPSLFFGSVRTVKFQFSTIPVVTLFSFLLVFVLLTVDEDSSTLLNENTSLTVYSLSRRREGVWWGGWFLMPSFRPSFSKPLNLRLTLRRLVTRFSRKSCVVGERWKIWRWILTLYHLMFSISLRTSGCVKWLLLGSGLPKVHRRLGPSLGSRGLRVRDN